MASDFRKIVAGVCLLFSVSVYSEEEIRLDFAQSQNFRSWFTRIVREQLVRGPSPRWAQQDCAGLVRFGVSEALRTHDRKWLHASGMEAQGLPPEIDLRSEQRTGLATWNVIGGGREAYAPAIGIVQENSRFVSKDLNQARPGDLLFFDQGDEQHLMIWMGSYVAYHTGTRTKKDPGLRAIPLESLMHWKDTRWHPKADNPNFIGLYRLSFLSY
jgi:uncharacterized protein YfaT (DUF1175 family)